MTPGNDHGEPPPCAYRWLRLLKLVLGIVATALTIWKLLCGL